MMTKSDDDFLDDLFDMAQAHVPDVPDHLMAQVLHDAQAVRQAQDTVPAASLFAGFFDMIGGWPSVGGLAVAGVAGLWLGISPPAAVSSWTADLFGTPVTVDLLGDTSDYFMETLTNG